MPPTAETIHVIVISSVRPEPTSAGQIILHRHLVNQPGITLEIHGSEPKRPGLSRLIRRVAGRLGKTRLHRWVEDFWILWDGRWIDPELPATVAHPQRSIVLTVAHGDGFMAARRFAERHKLPLVSIYHDWWPDMVEAHQPFKRILDWRFKSMAHESATAFCVCEGMREALGAVVNPVILPPLSAIVSVTTPSPRVLLQPSKVLYFGNLSDYGSMLGDALEESLKHPDILLQVRGANPAWSDERKTRMRANGRWLDFAPREELDEWLASADAFLVPMVFDPEMRRRMETSFPSKLIEFAQFGKPIVVWGPGYCSAVRWAEDGDKGLCVTETEPTRLIEALHEIRRDTSRWHHLAQQALNEAAGPFAARHIQSEFMRATMALIHGSQT